MLTAADIIPIGSDEALQDLLRLSGAGHRAIHQPILQSMRPRLQCLVTNHVTATLAATVVGLFQATISKFVVLAVLMPIVSGMGGNAGTQTMAVAVRALATNQLTSSHTMRQIVREFRIASANGTALGILIGLSVGL